MELYEFKFYKSYQDTFDMLSDEEAGKLLKRMYKFYFNGEDIKTNNILVETLFSQIKYTMEKSIKGKITGGIRKKEDTYKGSSEDTSEDTYKGSSTKDKEQVKEKDIKEEFINYSKLYKEDNKNIGSYLLYVFLDLGYIPAKDETLETFRLWFKEKIIDSHKINGIGELRGIINNYHSYRLEEKKKPKIFKTSFLNSPLLSNLKK